MNAGLLWAADIVEYSISGTATFTRSGTQGVQAGSSLRTEFSIDALLAATGLNLTIETEIVNGDADVDGVSLQRCEIPALGIDEFISTSSGWVGTMSVRAEFDDVRVWLVAVAGVFKIRVEASAVRVYIGGSLVYTHGSFQLDSSFWAPSGIPLFGIPPTLAASASVNPAITQGALAGICEERNTYATAEITATGGFRFKVRGEASWSSLPVTLSILEPNAVTCALAASREDPVATSTWGATVNAYNRASDVATYRGEEECWECTNGTATSPAVFDVWDRLVNWDLRSSQVTLVPDLAKSVKRWGDGGDYRALIQRGGLPWTKAAASAQCVDWHTEDIDTSTPLNPEVHPEYSAMLLPVDNAPSTIEDPFSETSYAPYQINTLSFEASNFCIELITPGACPAVLPEEPPGTIIPCIVGDVYAVTHQIASSFGLQVQESSGAGSNPDMLAYLDHAEAMHRYINFVVNPHWSDAYFFPPNTEDTDDDGIPDEQQVWQLLGADCPYEYYTDSRRQWITHPALDPGDDHQTTNSLVSAPLRDGWMSLKWKGIWGTETSPWGITRFVPYAWDPLASLTVDSSSEDNWSGTDCTLSFGAQVEVDPSADECVVEFDLASIAVPPYMYPQICGSVTLGWDLTNVDAIAVYLVTATGEEFLLTNNIEGTFTYTALLATLGDSFYAGSWKQDFGVGYITDEGGDSLPAGVSAATMGDMTRVTAFQLLSALQGAKLRYRITPTDHTGANIELDYPTFTAAASPQVIQEQGHHSAIIHSNGPGVRFGSWAWAIYVLGAAIATATPVVQPPGTRWAGYGHKASVLDFLRFKNVLARAEAYNDDFATDMALFEPDEGTTDSDAATDTLSFFVNSEGSLIGILVNTWREVPPLAMFPWRARDGDMQPTGAFVQEAFSLAQSPRRYVSSTDAIHLVDPSGPTTWTTLEATVGNWLITAHEQPIDNNETLFQITRSGLELAQGRPWWGYFASVSDNISDEGVLAISADVGLDKRHVIAWIRSDGSVVVGIEDHALSHIDQTVLGFTADAVHIKIDRASNPQRIHLYTVESGSVYVRESVDGGRVFGSGLLVGTGTQVTAEIALNGTEYVYWIDGSDIKGRRYDRAQSALEAEFTAVAGVDNVAPAVTAFPVGQGKQRLVLRYVVGGVRLAKTSTDGITFA